MMIMEAMQWIEAVAKKALTRGFKRRPGDPPHVVFKEKVDGSLEQTTVVPGYREIAVGRIDHLIAMARSHFDHDIKTGNRQLITYNSGRIELVFDYTTGRERAYVALEQTMEHQFFERRRHNPQIEVADFRKALRLELSETFDNPELINQVSALTFNHLSRMDVQAGRERESLGRSVELSVDQGIVAPDALQEFRVRKYTNPDINVRYPLVCVLDPDKETKRWSLQPREGSWLSYESMVMDLIGSRLREDLKDTGITIIEGQFNQEQPDFTDAG